VVGVVQGLQPASVDRGGPGVAVEAEPADPLEGPAGDDRLAGRVAGGMVVVAPLRGALGVAARPGGHIHREHQRVGGRSGVGEQVPEPLGVDPSAGQRGIDTAPAAPVDRLEAQVRQRRDRLGAHQRVAQLEQRISAAGEAGMQPASEGAEPGKGGSWHRHDRAA
jgi:hypothetical protein